MKKIISKMKKILSTVGATIFLVGSKVFATGSQITIDSNGGAILTDVGSKFVKIISDCVATLQIVIPIVGVLMILWFLIKVATGDEQDNRRYKSFIVRTLVVIVVAELTVVLVNLIMKYFI